jgi:hypothetical protein
MSFNEWKKRTRKSMTVWHSRLGHSIRSRGWPPTWTSLTLTMANRNWRKKTFEREASLSLSRSHRGEIMQNSEMSFVFGHVFISRGHSVWMCLEITLLSCSLLPIEWLLPVSSSNCPSRIFSLFPHVSLNVPSLTMSIVTLEFYVYVCIKASIVVFLPSLSPFITLPV